MWLPFPLFCSTYSPVVPGGPRWWCDLVLCLVFAADYGHRILVSLAVCPMRPSAQLDRQRIQAGFCIAQLCRSVLHVHAWCFQVVVCSSVRLGSSGKHNQQHDSVPSPTAESDRMLAAACSAHIGLVRQMPQLCADTSCMPWA